jgi:hypothetical protein
VKIIKTVVKGGDRGDGSDSSNDNHLQRKRTLTMQLEILNYQQMEILNYQLIHYQPLAEE